METPVHPEASPATAMSASPSAHLAGRGAELFHGYSAWPTAMVGFSRQQYDRVELAQQNTALLLGLIRVYCYALRFVPAGGVNTMAPDITTILDRHAKDRTELMDILWDVQRGYGYIPDEPVQAIASWLGLAPEDVMETATFYHFFDTAPSGRYRIYLCNTVIAKLHGYQQVYEALERETGTRFGGPGSADFGLFETACIGQSDHEPAMLIDDVVFTDLTPTSVANIISRLKRGQSPAEIANPSGLSPGPRQSRVSSGQQ
jgi:NADH:ubiquinone oxidoreductase subunit E